MFRFWYRFVFPNMSAVVAGLGDAVFDNEVEGQINAYMGLVFEDICKQWLFEQAKRNTLPFFIGNLGRWWGTNDKTRAQEEIDIMAVRNNEALFAECKWKNADVGMEVFRELQRKSKIFKFEKTHLYIFSKIMFTADLLVQEYEHGGVTLYTLVEMIEAIDPEKTVLS